MSLTAWFVLCCLCYAYAAWVKQKRSEKLRKEDPEEWARDRDARRARNRAIAGGAVKIAGRFLKR